MKKKYYMLLQEVKSSATEFNEAFFKQPAKKVVFLSSLKADLLKIHDFQPVVMIKCLSKEKGKIHTDTEQQRTFRSSDYTQMCLAL